MLEDSFLLEVADEAFFVYTQNAQKLFLVIVSTLWFKICLSTILKLVMIVIKTRTYFANVQKISLSSCQSIMAVFVVTLEIGK